MSNSISIAEHTLSLRLPINTQDLNWGGKAFGGWLVSCGDVAGYLLAAQKYQTTFVTTQIKDFIFCLPGYVGDILSIYGKIISVGNSSLEMELLFLVDRAPLYAKKEKIAEAKIVYMAVNAQGRPSRLPELVG